MGPLGWPETVFIVILALLLFGPKKLPELGRTLGKAITEFRRASSELRSTFDREMKNLERETEVLKENTTAHFQDSYNYDYSSYDTGTPYNPDTPIEGALADSHHTDSVHMIEGASAIEGARLTAAEPQPALSVTPAPGSIANGSLSENHAAPGVPTPGDHVGPREAAQDTVTS
ncbi:MAG: twin-arginine translocase TatA/TatE family subunit [Acidobacteriales bacterium]|nr:twin-arginine translocase TatA/TatE family subunit [Terriglobales bacterium]